MNAFTNPSSLAEHKILTTLGKVQMELVELKANSNIANLVNFRHFQPRWKQLSFGNHFSEMKRRKVIS